MNNHMQLINSAYYHSPSVTLAAGCYRDQYWSIHGPGSGSRLWILVQSFCIVRSSAKILLKLKFTEQIRSDDAICWEKLLSELLNKTFLFNIKGVISCVVKLSLIFWDQRAWCTMKTLCNFRKFLCIQKEHLLKTS